MTRALRLIFLAGLVSLAFAAQAQDPMAQGRALEAEGKFTEAVRVYRLAARKGSGPAARRLGEIYERGVPGVNPDPAESRQWYEMSRQQGEQAPMRPVAIEKPGKGPAPEIAALDPMAHGRALEAEGKFRDAVRTYRSAARKGNGPAARRLSEIFERGVPGINRDPAESLQWCEAARQAGETVDCKR